MSHMSRNQGITVSHTPTSRASRHGARRRGTRTLWVTPARVHVSRARSNVVASLSHVTTRPSSGSASAMAVEEYP